MADAHLVLPFYCLENLAVVGGEIVVEEPQILMDDICLQLGRVGDVESRFGLGKTAVPVVDNLAGKQIVPHAGGVAVIALKMLHYLGKPGGEVVQIPKQQVKVNAVAESAIVFQLPEVVAVFHIGGIFAQDLPAGLLGNGSGAVKINIIIGRLVKITA